MAGAVKKGRGRYNDRGYTRILKDGKWELKQRLMWQRAHGPIPDGYCILFLDGNRRHLRLANLACVPKGTVSSVNKTLGTRRNPELTKAFIMVRELEQAVKGAKEWIKD